MPKRRFKIDLSGSGYHVFGLFIERIGWFRSAWERIETFETHEKAKAYWEKIKDLPEYL